jgi:H+-translocating NAD(P) transhydrogenase subunit beta
MPVMIPQFAVGAIDMMAISLLMSGLAMLILILASSIYVCSVTASGISLTFDAGLAAFGFVVNKLWVTSTFSMVALYNSIGGGAAGAFAVGELFSNTTTGTIRLGVTLAGALIGIVSLSGSVIAWTKLHGLINQPLRVTGDRAFSLAVAVMAIVTLGYIVLAAQNGSDRLIGMPGPIYLLTGCALLVGVLMTLSIGRTQMPMVISIYNVFTCLAVGLEGFARRSSALMIAGIAVGTSRMLLTLPMASYATNAEALKGARLPGFSMATLRE